MGADYLEQDVVASRDDALIVLHDIHLDRVSNVAEIYPRRHRTDGRYYVRDFDLAELRTLSIWERMNADGSAVFPGRFPARTGEFRINTLDEELQLVAALNKSTDGNVGIYPEIKRPAWHRDEGVDVASIMLDTLARFDYQQHDANVFVQCFDQEELVRIRRDLGCELPLVQLIGENAWGESPTDFSVLLTPDGLRGLADVVDGIGPFFEQLYRIDRQGVTSTGVVEQAHRCGLAVHPYTFRADALPTGFDDFDTLLEFALVTLKVDGIFTDFADRARRAIDALALQKMV